MDALSVCTLDIADHDVRALLLRHHALMRSQTPEESCHVMDPDSLLDAGAVLLGVREAGALLGLGALVTLKDGSGEIKSMHTAAEARGKGVGRLLINALLDHARAAGLKRVSLETGSFEDMAAARALYLSAGFAPCPPFGSYREDPLSVFMTRRL